MLSDLLFLSRRQLRRDVYCLDISNASDSSISQLKEKASHILNLPYRLFLYDQQFRPVLFVSFPAANHTSSWKSIGQKKPQSRRTAALLA